jgi:NAD(P)-dependent dehydrogenase (short-subunit alcohol dehydrogenase family)
MKISFENKVALVTGAASGLGLATAKAFAEARASVVLADWNEKEVQAAAKDLASKGHTTLAGRFDVSDDAQVEAMVKKTVATFGRLDAAYNNAGIQNVLAETADSPREDYDRVMSINLRGVSHRTLPPLNASEARADAWRSFALIKDQRCTHAASHKLCAKAMREEPSRECPNWGGAAELAVIRERSQLSIRAVPNSRIRSPSDFIFRQRL